MKRKIIIGLIVLLLSLQLVTALGIRPARTHIAPDDTKTHSGKFWVVNEEKNEFSLKVRVEGELAEYITLKDDNLDFREDIDALPVEFDVTLPQIMAPGESTASIVVEQMLEQLSGNIISSKITMKHKIIMERPYPDKFVKAKLNFHDNGDRIRIVSEVVNLGGKDINTIQSKFYVNDKQQEEHILETEKTSLRSKENKLLETSIEKDYFERGEFDVLSVTQYDGNQVEVANKMLIGRPEIEVSYFDQYFIVDKVNEYTMDLLNRWNQEIKNVYVDIEVKKDEQNIDQFRTKSIDVGGLVTKRINDYFDTKGMEEGTYSFDMVVNFWNTYRMESKRFSAEIMAEEEIESPPLPEENSLVGKAVGTKNDTIEIPLPLLWIILGIILGVFSMYVIYRYLHRHEYDGGEEKAF